MARIKLKMKTYTVIPKDVIISALTKLENYIKPTYGPAGKAILVDYGHYQKMLDDGYMAIDEFELPDPLENAVIKFVKAASFQANKRAGDGTTTATLLMIELVRSAFLRNQDANLTVLDLKAALTEALLHIHGSRRLVDSEQDLLRIAFNAYRDAASAEMVAKVVKEVGPDGVVTVQGGEALQTTSEVVKGMSIPNGFYSPYLSNEAGKVELEDPLIVLTTSRIVSNKQLIPLLKAVQALGKREVLIVCDDMEGEAMTTAVMNRMKGNFNLMVVKAPYHGVAKKDFLDDLAIVTGATVIDDVSGHTLDLFTASHFGRAGKTITTRDNTLVINGQGIQGQLDSRIEAVRELLKEQPNNDAIAARLARLTGGIGVIKVGANSEAEIITKKAKIDDAIHATQLAYRTGVVAGGGLSFSNVPETSSLELNDALQFPLQVLIANGSHAIDSDVEDAYGVVQSALETGVSIACLLIECGGIITKDNDETARQ